MQHNTTQDRCQSSQMNKSWSCVNMTLARWRGALRLYFVSYIRNLFINVGVGGRAGHVAGQC